MLSNTAADPTRVGTEDSAGSAPPARDISPEAIDRYVATGHYLRGGSILDHGRLVWAALRRLVTGGKRAGGSDDPEAQFIHDLRTPLTSIRSYSEILRNHPRLSPAQRAHYLDIILAESKRLEQAISHHEAGSGPSASG